MNVQLTRINTAGNHFNLNHQNVVATGNAGDVINFGVSTGAVGTTYVMSVDLIGYLI